MSLPEIFGILILAGGAWLWLDSLKARETAVRAARAACASEGLMLLDDTVAISGLKPARNEAGRIQLQRAYDFRIQRQRRQPPHGQRSPAGSPGGDA